VADRNRDASDERTLHNRRIARLGGLAFAANHDGRQATAAARTAFRSSFENAIRLKFPELSDAAEIDRRAAALRRLHFAQLAYKSAAARSKKGRRS
jgi:hypothetical protein